MSEEQELETLKGEIVEHRSHEELVKLVLRQQKIIKCQVFWVLPSFW
jgi:hypothetical protein